MVEATYEKLSKRDFQLHGNACWELWYNRNLLVWKGRRMGDAELVHKATQETTAWRSIHHVDTPFESQMSSTPSCNWNPSEIGFIKCNIDGALSRSVVW